jgi:hypothetical protein
VEERSAIY